MIVTGGGAVAIALLTWAGFPSLAPLATGLVMGLVRPGRAGRKGAAAGGLAWAALLAADAMRGTPIAAVSARLGGAMGLPGWAPPVAAVLLPAILAASASWVGQAVSPRRGRPAPAQG